MFNKNRKFYSGPFEGYIGFFGLNQFWEDFFSIEEKDVILDQLPSKSQVSSNSSLRHLTREDLFVDKLSGTSKSRFNFISDFAAYFDIFSQKHVIDRIVEYLENYEINFENSLDFHFMYSKIITRYFRSKEDKLRALELSIPYCIRQIGICDYAKVGFQRDKLDILPSHAGFLTIIKAYEMKHDFANAEKHAQQAKEKWSNPGENDWDIVMERIKRKIQRNGGMASSK